MTPPQAPFEIPPIITYAVPAFVLLIIIEMLVIRLTNGTGPLPPELQR